MKIRSMAIAGAIAVVAATAPGVAQAAAPTFTFAGYAGGSQITAVGLTVTSDLTAASQVVGSGNQATTNSIAKVSVAGLVSVGAVTTDSTGTPFGDGSKVVTHARTAGISLLNGLIAVKAIDTTATASANSTSAPTANTQTTFLGLVIAGKSYPANLAPNTNITIPGIASIMVNFDAAAANKSSAATLGDGLVVTLLKARSGAAAGAQIALNPVYAAVNRATSTSDGNPVGGFGYGSYVHAQVGNVAQVESGQTALNNLPSYGTNGITVTSSTAKVSLPGVLNLGAIQSSGSGIQSTSLSDAVETAKVAGVNLFNGLITATAIGTTAHASLQNGVGTLTGSLQFVNLKIAGKVIPIDVSPNTSLNIAGLGKVTINEQDTAHTAAGWGVKCIGLHIVLNTARAGLPVGANIEVATSGAVIYGG